MGYRLLQAMAAAVLLIGSLGAGGGFWGGTTQPLTDAVTIGIINTTPYRAIFTVGAWEPLDRESLPQFANLRVSAKDPENPGVGVIYAQTQVLASGTSQPGCRRAIAIGSPDLIQQINRKKDILSQVTPPLEITNEAAMVTGVNFSDAPEDSPDVDNPTVGSAEPIVLDHGVDYPCGSAVILTLVEDAGAKGGFRIDAGTIY